MRLENQTIASGVTPYQCVKLNNGVWERYSRGTGIYEGNNVVVTPGSAVADLSLFSVETKFCPTSVTYENNGDIAKQTGTITFYTSEGDEEFYQEVVVDVEGLTNVNELGFVVDLNDIVTENLLSQYLEVL